MPAQISQASTIRAIGKALEKKIRNEVLIEANIAASGKWKRMAVLNISFQEFKGINNIM